MHGVLKDVQRILVRLNDYALLRYLGTRLVLGYPAGCGTADLGRPAAMRSADCGALNRGQLASLAVELDPRTPRPTWGNRHYVLIYK